MPSKTEAQRKLFGIAEAIKKGRAKASYSPAAAKIAKQEPLSAIREFSRKPVKP